MARVPEKSATQSTGRQRGEPSRSAGFREDALPAELPRPVSTIGSREFNQDVGKAKRAAEKGPVTITDRGKPAFVLMRYEDYRRLAGRPRTLADMLADNRPEADFDFEFPRLSDDMGLRIPDFSDD